MFNEKTKDNYIISNTGGNYSSKNQLGKKKKNQLGILIIPLMSYFKKKRVLPFLYNLMKIQCNKTVNIFLS